jgi:hypothetical protein
MSSVLRRGHEFWPWGVYRWPRNTDIVADTWPQMRSFSYFSIPAVAAPCIKHYIASIDAKIGGACITNFDLAISVLPSGSCDSRSKLVIHAPPIFASIDAI